MFLSLGGGRSRRGWIGSVEAVTYVRISLFENRHGLIPVRSLRAPGFFPTQAIEAVYKPKHGPLSTEQARPNSRFRREDVRVEHDKRHQHPTPQPNQTGTQLPPTTIPQAWPPPLIVKPDPEDELHFCGDPDARHQHPRSASNVQPHRRALSGWVSGQSMTHPFRQLSGTLANQRMVPLATIALVLVYGTSFVHGRTYPLISCSFLV